MHAQMGKLMSFEEYYIWKKPVFYKISFYIKWGEEEIISLITKTECDSITIPRKSHQ